MSAGIPLPNILNTNFENSQVDIADVRLSSPSIAFPGGCRMRGPFPRSCCSLLGAYPAGYGEELEKTQLTKLNCFCASSWQNTFVINQKPRVL